MVNGKRKGKAGELEAVRLCKSEGYECHRTAQFCGNSEEGAADIVGLPGIHVEVKRVERLNIETQQRLTRLFPLCSIGGIILPGK